MRIVKQRDGFGTVVRNLAKGDAVYLHVGEILWGSVIIGLSDNLLYPFLVGKRLHYHTLIVFFFLLGGIVLFGTSGVVLGPLTLALTDGLLQACRTKLGMPAQQDAD